jgi:primosomal protein N' (replication factor Y) (superfamily II helicase)
MSIPEIQQRYADIALNLPVPGLFTYGIPETLAGIVQVGSRVLVPFGLKNKKLLGIVMGFKEQTEFKKTKNILRVLDPYPALDKELMQLTRWVSEYYLCPLGEAIHAAAPPPGRGKHHISAELLDKAELYEHHKFDFPTHLTPTAEQEKALKTVCESLDSQKFNVILLYGVTGSGKTEIYLQSIAHVLAQKKNALILVPEIALTYQLIQRFRERFGEKIAVLHSGLIGKERTKDWRRIRQGEARVIIGVRSAVFAPVRQLGLIIVDEEHETSFKQENSPRYNARDVAVMRGKFLNATVLLGSATPSLESYYHAQTKKYKLVELTQRIDNRLMPHCRIIDMRQEWDLPKGNQIISSSLQNAIVKRLEKKEQVLLFLNRRGFSTILLCRSCGKAVYCNRCSVPLTFHQVTMRAHCHYCGLRYNAPTQCSACGAELIRHLGLGTQQVETEVEKLFPAARTARLDVDVAKKRGEYEHVLENFITGKTDILLGTQMIAKGMDIPNVTLVGVINADMLVNLPDFRSAERAYALLTQVSGRAGRGNVPGEVLIQTYNPSHYSLQAVLKGERHTFYVRELRNRKKVFFPPYCRLLLILLQHSSQQHAKSIAEHIALILKEKIKAEEYQSVEVFGPAAAPKVKLKDKYRYHVLLKCTRSILMRELYEYVSAELPKRVKLSGVSISTDMDPLMIQ